MRTIPLFIAAAVFTAFFGAQQAHAASISAGDLIKASGPAIYYYSANGKRLVFPTEKTFKTWFADFSSVKTITDTELSAIMLGGNVTYKPGVKLVKITTDPKVYAVSTGGTLRHVATEQVASSLYGPDWAKKVDDIPDPFFVNYKVGSPINSMSEFTPSSVTALAISIDADKAAVPATTPCTTCQLPSQTTTTTPSQTTTTNANVTLALDKSKIKPGDLLNLTGNAYDSKGMQSIKLYFDNQLVNSCNYTTICTGSVIVPVTANKDTYEARMEALTLGGVTYTKSANVTLDRTADTGMVSLRVDQASVRSGQSTGITVEAPNVAVYHIDIYVDGSAVKGCQSGIRICQWSQPFTGVIGATHTAYGLVTDTVGRTYSSETKTITIAANDTPAVTVLAGKPIIYAGETVDITVSASDENGIQSLDVLDANKNLLKHCEGPVACTFVTPAQTQKGTLTFYGRATDLLGGKGEQTATVTVQ